MSHLNELPVPLFRLILAAIPVRHFAVLRCVCKHWDALVTGVWDNEAFWLQSARTLRPSCLWVEEDHLQFITPQEALKDTPYTQLWAKLDRFTWRQVCASLEADDMLRADVRAALRQEGSPLSDVWHADRQPLTYPCVEVEERAREQRERDKEFLSVFDDEDEDFELVSRLVVSHPTPVFFAVMVCLSTARIPPFSSCLSDVTGELWELWVEQCTPLIWLLHGMPSRPNAMECLKAGLFLSHLSEVTPFLDRPLFAPSLEAWTNRYMSIASQERQFSAAYEVFRYYIPCGHGTLSNRITSSLWSFQVNRYVESATSALAAVDVDASSWTAYQHFGRCCQRFGLLEIALSALTRSFVLHPDIVVLARCCYVKAQLGHGYAAVNTGRYAVGLGNDGPDLDSSKALSHSMLALALMAVGRLKDSLRECDFVLNDMQNRKHTAAIIQKCMTYWMMGKHKEALRAANLALSQWWASSNAMLVRAMVFHTHPDWWESVGTRVDDGDEETMEEGRQCAEVERPSQLCVAVNSVQEQVELDLRGFVATNGILAFPDWINHVPGPVWDRVCALRSDPTSDKNWFMPYPPQTAVVMSRIRAMGENLLRLEARDNGARAEGKMADDIARRYDMVRGVCVKQV